MMLVKDKYQLGMLTEGMTAYDALTAIERSVQKEKETHLGTGLYEGFAETAMEAVLQEANERGAIKRHVVVDPRDPNYGRKVKRAHMDPIGRMIFSNGATRDLMSWRFEFADEPKGT